MSDFTPKDMMEAYSLDAIDFVNERYGVKLDFSFESIEYVETILSQLHEVLIKENPPQDRVEGMAMVMGGYVGEVFRRNWGGEWMLESTIQPGQIITLRIQGTEIYPANKVFNRLTNGPEDNIWDYARILATSFNKPNP